MYHNHDVSQVSQPDDDQSILIETSSFNLRFFSELITTQLREFHMVSPQVVFNLLIFLTVQCCKFYPHFIPLRRLWENGETAFSLEFILEIMTLISTRDRYILKDIL